MTIKFNHKNAAHRMARYLWDHPPGECRITGKGLESKEILIDDIFSIGIDGSPCLFTMTRDQLSNAIRYGFFAYKDLKNILGALIECGEMVKESKHAT